MQADPLQHLATLVISLQLQSARLTSYVQYLVNPSGDVMELRRLPYHQPQVFAGAHRFEMASSRHLQDLLHININRKIKGT